MAKKQTRRSISVSRTTYERLKSFCETNNISMSQLVETQVNGFLGTGPGDETPTTAPTTPAPRAVSPIAAAPRPVTAPSLARPFEPRSMTPAPSVSVAASGPIGAPVAPRPQVAVASPAIPSPMTSAAARFAVDPPPPIIKPRQDTAAPKPAEKSPDQIFTF